MTMTRNIISLNLPLYQTLKRNYNIPHLFTFLSNFVQGKQIRNAIDIHQRLECTEMINEMIFLAISTGLTTSKVKCTNLAYDYMLSSTSINILSEG